MQNVDKFINYPVNSSYRSVFGRKVVSSDKRSIFMFLKSTFGIGSSRILVLCSSAGILPAQPVYSLGESKFIRLNATVSKFLISRRLHKRTTSDILETGRLKTYKYFRLVQGLPVRNQRTHTNGHTSRRRDRSVLRTLVLNSLG